MKVLIDTPIWSLALRRRNRSDNVEIRSELGALIEDGRVAIIGPVRQELLSGIKEQAHFDRVRDHMRAFNDTEVTLEDFEQAASFYNRCREKGVQGSNTDFLICAVAVRNELSVFTTDDDFKNFQGILPILLHEPSGREP